MNQQNQKLYVGNLNFDSSEDQVRELFGSFGPVKGVKIVMDRFSGRSRGFAFVEMETSEGAGKAKDALNGQPFQGKTLVIDWARTEQDRGPRTDRPMGDRGPRSGGGEFRPRRDFGGDDRGERRSFRGGERGERGGDRSGGFYNR